MPLNSERRKSLYGILPEGTVITRQKLMESGMGRHAIDNLLKSNQMEARSQGVYARARSKPVWQGIVYSLQSMFKDFTVGGLTALELQGLAHYLPLSDKKTIHLYSTMPLPHWACKLLPDIDFIMHNERTLLGKANAAKNKTAHSLDQTGKKLSEFTDRYDWKDGALPMTISVPERAYLEILAQVPETFSFEHADQLMQGMASLSPRKLQILLELCHNIKVRRLFFWFAERNNHAWLKKLDVEKISLGSGNRALAKNGRLDTKYRITVPENL